MISKNGGNAAAAEARGVPEFDLLGSGVERENKSASAEIQATRLAAQLAMGDRLALNDPVCLTAVIELPVPASWSKRRTAAAIVGDIRPTSRPDVDNILKSAMDAINRMVVADDSLIVKVTVERKFGVDPDFGPSPGQAAPHVTCPTNKSRATKQLEILALRSLELADQVAAGQLQFLDAVDLAYEAAVWGGVVEAVGNDIVQATLAASFANARGTT